MCQQTSVVQVTGLCGNYNGIRNDDMSVNGQYSGNVYVNFIRAQTLPDCENFISSNFDLSSVSSYADSQVN